MAGAAGVISSIGEAAGRGIGGAVQHGGSFRAAKNTMGSIDDALAESKASEQRQLAEQQGLYNPYMQAGGQATQGLRDFRMRESGDWRMQ